MDKSLSDMVKELELDRKSAKALEVMDAIKEHDSATRPRTKKYWMKRAITLNKELKEMEKGGQE